MKNKSWDSSLTMPPGHKQSSRLSGYVVLAFTVVFILLVAYIWFTQVSVPIMGKVGMSILSMWMAGVCCFAFHSLFAKTSNKAITYMVIIGGSVLAWHLVWLTIFSSPGGIWDWQIRFEWPDSDLNAGEDSGFEESGLWFRNYAPFYFKWLPMIMPAAALVLGWYARAFCKAHPVRFLTILLAAFSPIIFIACINFYFPRIYI